MQSKRFASRIFAVMLSAAMIVTAAQTAIPVAYASSYDGWSTSSTYGGLSGSASSVFTQAASTYTGAQLVPLCCYATQLVAGENYYYICRQGNDLKKVCVYCDFNGISEVSSVTDFNLNDYSTSYMYQLPDAPAPGSLEMYDSPAIELYGTAKKVFDDHFYGICGGSYSPIAFLGNRLNNGYNEYAYMVITSAVVPDPDYYMTVITLRTDSNGDPAGMVSHEILGRAAYNTDDGKINYQFTGAESDKAGYAEGVITLSADAAGTYKLYWANDTKALNGYYPIGEMTLKAGKSSSVTMGYHTAIPAGATKIIATTGSLYTSEAYSVYTIPKSKRLSAASGRELYSFSSYSDLHIDKRDGEIYWKRSEKNFKDALQLSADKDADFIVFSGDAITCEKPDKEWQTYEKILSQSNFTGPVWESVGNHELKDSDVVKTGLNKFVKATGTDGSVSKPYFSMVEPKTGDLFIFMALELSKDPNKDEVFSQTQLDWAKSIIEDNYNLRNIFLVEHAPVKGYCAGDRLTNPYYGGLMDSSIGTNKQFKQMLKDYPKVTFISGHTHEDFSMDYNYFDDNGNAANMIHNPALAGTTLPKDDSSLDYFGGDHDSCQGYHVQVFENEIVFNGLSVTDGLIFPQYSYIMEGARTSTSEIKNSEREIILTGTQADASDVLAKANFILTNYYTYSSYDRYQAIKKLYYQYKGNTMLDQAVINEFEDRFNSFELHTGPINYNSVGNKYYFTNNKKWSSVYAYAWTGSSKNAEWPGVKLSKVDTNSSGEDIYEVKFNSAGEFQNIIFNSGSSDNQTVDIALPQYSENAFYISGTESGKYTVGSWTYKGSGTDPEQPDQPTLTDKVYLNYYISGEHDWSNYDTPFTAGTDKYAYTFTSKGSNNLSFSIYNKTTGKYICVPESIKPTYEEGVSATYSLTKMSSRGSSVTIYGLSAGKKVDIEYDPAASTVTVTFGEKEIITPPAPEELVNNSSINSDKLTVGSKLTFTGAAAGGTAPYTYTYSYKRTTAAKWTILGEENTDKTSIYMTPSATGTFDMKVTVKDATGAAADKTFSLTVLDGRSTAFANTSAISSSGISPNTRFYMYGSATGSSGFKYAYYYKRTTARSWTLIGTEFGSDTELYFTPRTPGEFNIKIDIMDANGEIVSKQFAMTVNDKYASSSLVNNSTINTTSAAAGTQIIMTGAASGSSGYKYAFYYKKAQAANWSVIGTEYGTATTGKVTLRNAGDYILKTDVMDADGNVTSKGFSVRIS